MSRGFVKEEDQEEAPIIPPRAALPAGVDNYVTPNGMEELREEKRQLEQQRLDNQQQNETEKRRTNMEIDGKLQLLNDRIRTARVVDISNQPQNEVRFGATVTYSQGKSKHTITITGVDEADIKKGKVAFVAPLVRAMTGKKEGESAEFTLGERQLKLEILKIEYQT